MFSMPLPPVIVSPDLPVSREGRRTTPLRIIMALVLIAIGLVGLLQLSRDCSEWRAWKASKAMQRYVTLELVVPPSYCIGSRTW